MPNSLRRLFLFAVLFLPACDAAPPRQVDLTGPTMGTTYSATLARPPGDLDRAALRETIDARLADIERQMSTYDPESELSRFNQQQTTDWFPVSPAVVKVIDEAARVSRFSAGAFDVTVGPLVDLWGFGPKETRAAAPDMAQVARAQALVGYEKLQIRMDPPALRKTTPGLRVDLSAIAKGYAVDELSRLLSARGLNDHLVEIGGELRGKGHNARDRPWRIGVENPGPGLREAYAAVYPGDRGLATSGDYRNAFERDGQRYTHVIDPIGGRAQTHALASVTVVAASCMRADALATALLTAGPERGYRLAERAGIAALFIERTDRGFTDRATVPMLAFMPEYQNHATNQR